MRNGLIASILVTIIIDIGFLFLHHIPIFYYYNDDTDIIYHIVYFFFF